MWWVTSLDLWFCFSDILISSYLLKSLLIKCSWGSPFVNGHFDELYTTKYSLKFLYNWAYVFFIWSHNITFLGSQKFSSSLALLYTSSSTIESSRYSYISTAIHIALQNLTREWCELILPHGDNCVGFLTMT